MPEQAFKIEFTGYWRESHKGSLPERSGVYCVYTCFHNTEKNTIVIQQLIYIGEADNVYKRISNHDKQKDWESHLKAGEQLCYSFGPIISASRERCEAALIFKHKPPENDMYVDEFPFDQTTIMLSGKIRKLHPSFTVNRT